MSKFNLFCFGFGQVAENFVNKLLKEKLDFNLNITSRKESNEINFNGFKFNSFNFNEEKFDKSLKIKLEEANYILISIPPFNNEDVVLKYFNSDFRKLKKCKWITYLSATSVYGDHKGEWVNETSVTKPTSLNGVERLRAENLWKDLSKKNNLPLQIFRLAGIYSNKYNILKRLQSGSVRIVNKDNHFFSRVHVEDIANILFNSLKYFKNNEIYNISDDKPASQIEIATYAAKLLNMDIPKTIKLEELENGMLKNFYKDSKKVNNKKMKSFFKYKLKFPTYIEGLNNIINN